MDIQFFANKHILIPFLWQMSHCLFLYNVYDEYSFISFAANCEKGSFFDEVLKTCQKCPAGEYQDEKYKKKCKKCEPGKTTENPGSADSADCIGM